LQAHREKDDTGRISAQKRRESVISAAIAEFAITGYHGTSTATIARRVGVTQPYLFRLFPDKKAIFVAALTRSMEDTRRAFEGAADGAEGGERALQAMTKAYAQPMSTRPETLLMQMQGYAVAADAEARGDDPIGGLVRAGWMRIRETVHLTLGTDADRTAGFFACGMLGNALAAIGLPPDAGRQGSVLEGRCVSQRPPRRAG
jgi:AcrR family transcriptional regulator